MSFGNFRNEFYFLAEDSSLELLLLLLQGKSKLSKKY